MNHPLLIIDASLYGVALAIADAAAEGGQRLVWQGLHLETRGAVAALAPLVERGLAECGLAEAHVQGLGGVVVSTGPGSFTGIKAGLAFAHGLKAAVPRLKLLGLGALEAAAATLTADGAAEPADLALFLPATRTHGFWTRAQAGRAAAAALLDVDAAGTLAMLPKATRLMIAGAWPLLEARLHDLGRRSAALDHEALARAALQGMAEAAARAWAQGDFTEQLLAPRYLRPSTAEERLTAGGGT